MNVNVDFLGPNGPQGALASMIAKEGRLTPGLMRPFVGSDGRSYVTIATYVGGDPKKKESYKRNTVPIQANATLRRDEWKQLEQAVQTAATIRLTGVQDLIDNNCVMNIGNGMASTVLEWHTRSQAHQATISMDGVNRSQGDRVDYKHHYMPLPLLHVDFEINERFLQTSRLNNRGADVSEAEEAARAVTLLREQMLFTDITYAYGEKDTNLRNSIYSYVNFPDRNIDSLTAAWTSATAAQIIADVIAMKQKSLDDLHFGPWVLYIPATYETVMDQDYDDDAGTSARTVRQRILAIEGITSVKVADTLATNNVLLVEMRPETVRLVRGLPLQTIQWKEEGFLINKFKVITLDVPQIRSDYNGRCGLVHYSI
ncbi:MAG: hypothetical protein D4R73_09165 [Deltaproteobacteria bacterium]|nr:MAG: hypothetical protein D4R73_09165 [Deltaproteobacteria bacterium]